MKYVSMHCMLCIEPTCSGNVDKKYLFIVFVGAYRQIFYVMCYCLLLDKWINSLSSLCGFADYWLFTGSQKDDKYSIEFRFYTILVINP